MIPYFRGQQRILSLEHTHMKKSAFYLLKNIWCVLEVYFVRSRRHLGIDCHSGMLYVLICILVCVCACVHACASVPQLLTSDVFFYHSPLCCFETGLLTGAPSFSQLGWLLSSRHCPVFACQLLGFQAHAATPAFFCDSEELNSGPHACKASTF